MIRNLLASTAIAGLLATGAYAQTTPAPEPMAPAATDMQQQPQIERAPGHLASNIIGETVYNGVGDDAENIGSVNDIVIGTHDGVEMIIIGVGGFLGIGQKNVAVPWAEVEWAERDGDWWLIVNTTREALESQPEFEVAAYDPALGLPPAADGATAQDDTVQQGQVQQDTAAAPADGQVQTDAEMQAAGQAPEGQVEGQAQTDTMAATDGGTTTTTTTTTGGATQDTAATQQPAGQTDQMETAAIDRGTLTEVPEGGMSAEELIGTTVYGVNEENIGSVGDVILSPDGQVDAIIVDVGGFLGLGAKEVAVGMENLQFMTDENGNYYLYTQFTQEQLEAQPEYDEATYAEQRDQQRLIVR